MIRLVGEDPILSGRLTHALVNALDWLGRRKAQSGIPRHQRTGRRGYVMVARNFRSPLRRGEIDLIAWDGDVLCFIEVKTRTTRAVKPAEAAVDRDKQRALTAVAHEYLRHLPPCQWRFDVLSVYYDQSFNAAQFELFRDAFS